MSTDLMDTFRQAVQWFNDFVPDNWPHLEPLLHNNINMKRIDDNPPNSYYVGKQAVHDYLFLGNGAVDRAVFRTDEPPHHQEIGNYGFVSGTATFTDPRGAKKIVYSFTYKRGDDWSNPFNWQEIHSWGKYI
jgi:hypothetical protein